MSIFKKIIGAVAPVLAAALPGPLGDMAKGVVEEVLGLKKGSSEEEIEKALAVANPEVLLKLREADNAFKVQMEQLGIDLLRLDVDDRASARARHVALKDKTPAVLAWVIVGGYLSALGYLLCCGLPEANSDAISRALGILDGALMLVLGYFYGSSAGSKAKTDALAAQNGK